MDAVDYDAWGLNVDRAGYARLLSNSWNGRLTALVTTYDQPGHGRPTPAVSPYTLPGPSMPSGEFSGTHTFWGRDTPVEFPVLRSSSCFPGFSVEQAVPSVWLQSHTMKGDDCRGGGRGRNGHVVIGTVCNTRPVYGLGVRLPVDLLVRVTRLCIVVAISSSRRLVG